jgi:hypothetical protein
MSDPENLPKARTFSEFVAGLEYGELNQQLSEKLRDIAAFLQNHLHDTGGGKAKAKLTVTFDFVLKDGLFEIVCDHKTKLPEVARPRSVAWATPDNFFAWQDPRQLTMFGTPRPVTNAMGGDSKPAHTA